MLSDGKDFIMSLVVSMGYCIEVVGKGGQGEMKTWKKGLQIETWQGSPNDSRPTGVYSTTHNDT